MTEADTLRAIRDAKAAQCAELEQAARDLETEASMARALLAEAQAEAAIADLEYGNAVRAAARDAEAIRLTDEGRLAHARTALTIEVP